MGYAPRDFYAECKDILQEEDVFGDLRWFVEKLLAVLPPFPLMSIFIFEFLG
jgi:hypothetical protein